MPAPKPSPDQTRRSTYTPAEQAAAYIHLTTYENISKASRDLGISRTTLHTWRDEWDANGLPADVQELVDNENSRFISKAEATRDKALAKLDQLIDKADDPRLIVGIATAMGIIHDKVVAVRSKARPAPKKLPPKGGLLDENAIAKLADTMMAQANQRNAEIGEATEAPEEQPADDAGLPPGL